MDRRLGDCTLVSLVVLALGLATAPPASAASHYCGREHAVFDGTRRVVGVTPWTYIAAASQHDRDCTFGLMAADHIGYVRFELAWAGVEPDPRKWDFSGYDRIVAELASHHLSWLPILMDAPTFATGGRRTTSRGLWAPTHPSQFATFSALAVKRYGPRGSFWKQNPELPYYPVHAWQIWNEPNLPYYWRPRPNPAGYARLLIAASKAIRAVDRHAEIVTAGMPYSSLGYPLFKFWAGIQRAGARRYYNAAALNNYAHTPSAAVAGLVNLRRYLNSLGDRRKALWLTEFGWADGGPPGIFTVGRRQGAEVAAFLRQAMRKRRAIGLQEIFYYDWRDVPVPRGTFNWWGLHTGLYAVSGAPKPAAATLSSFARKLNG